MAEYVMIKTFIENPKLLKEDIWQIFLKRAKKLTNFDDGVDKSIKWRHYQVGAILGFSLEKLSVPNWKESISNNTLTLNSILKKKLNISQQEIDQRYKILISSYTYTKLLIKANLEMSSYIKILSDYKSQFDLLPGMSVNIKIDSLSLSGGGVSERTYYLANGNTLEIDSTGNMSDNNQIFNLNYNVPQAYTGGSYQFKIDMTKHSLTIDGQEIDPKSIPHFQKFKTISVSGVNLSMDSKQSGILKMINNELFIEI